MIKKYTLSKRSILDPIEWNAEKSFLIMVLPKQLNRMSVDNRHMVKADIAETIAYHINEISSLSYNYRYDDATRV